MDVFANSIRRLGGLAGFENRGMRRIIKLAFVNGFPGHISIALQQLHGQDTMDMDEVITHARILTRDREQDQGTVAMSRRNTVTPTVTDDGQRWQRPRFAGRCFNCQGPHMARDCKEPRPEVRCYCCGQSGHISRNCQSGNERRGAIASVATPLPK